MRFALRHAWPWVVGMAMGCALPGVSQQTQPSSSTDSSSSSSPDAPQPQQSAPAQPQSSSPPANATPGAGAASGGDDNAFPLSKSEAAQKQAQAAAQKEGNDFPEAKSEAAQRDAGNGASGSAPASGQPPDEPYSSSAARDKGLDLLGNNDAPATDGAGHFVNNPTLAKEDIRVGKFYLSQGNYPGAYSRLKEATEVGPGNVEAVYLLAEAARKDSHLDEAVANYKLYLQVEPKGKYAKDARKALVEMAGK